MQRGIPNFVGYGIEQQMGNFLQSIRNCLSFYLLFFQDLWVHLSSSPGFQSTKGNTKLLSSALDIATIGLHSSKGIGLLILTVPAMHFRSWLFGLASSHDNQPGTQMFFKAKVR